MRRQCTHAVPLDCPEPEYTADEGLWWADIEVPGVGVTNDGAPGGPHAPV